MFRDRSDAGRRLAVSLADYRRTRPLVLALPRGGLPVALPVAQALEADLDVLIVRKLGVPGNPEFAMGAVGEDGIVVIDHGVRRHLHLTPDQVELVAVRERAEVQRRVREYRGEERPLRVAGRNVIIVDDGLATGSTAAAAVRVARCLGVGHLTLAVPVGSADAVAALRPMVDDLRCLEVPAEFRAVGQYYESFDQVPDEQVLAILRQQPRGVATPGQSRPDIDAEVSIPLAEITSLNAPVRLEAHLTVPPQARGVIVFAHGTGSDRHSPRNQMVAKALHAAGFGTLLPDLLTVDEASIPGATLGTKESADRLSMATAWLRERPEALGLSVGYFGSSSGAAAALIAAAEQPQGISAVVFRGGRPDLATAWLPSVVAPTLLIVGGNDRAILDLNRQAQRQLGGVSLVEVVKGATHLFEESGALPQVAALAKAWFLRHLQS